MSIWKSPVFYFGVVLLTVVLLALAAPFLVPWNNYKGDLEAFGQKLTGREVTIGGDVAVRLFPWPQLKGRQVTINNPQGFKTRAFVQAEEMTVRLSLAGLFNGTLDVEGIDVVRPVVNLQRNGDGTVNWMFVPIGKVKGAGLLSRVKLDKITLTEGVVSFDDESRNISTRLSSLGATLSAQAIEGPWRLKGDALWGAVPVSLSASTSAKLPDQPLKFGVKVLPVDPALPQAGFDGEWNGKRLEGDLRFDPQANDSGKASSEGALRPLAFQATLEGDENRVTLNKIRIAPVDRKDSGTLIEGFAAVELGEQSTAKVDLKSPRVNLDTLLGAGALQQWRDGGMLALANSLLKAMPEKLSTEYSVTVTVLTSGGQALNDVRLNGILQREAIRMKDATAELPGRSSGHFDGIIFPGAETAQLKGKMTFESSDSRAFVGWAAPSWRPSIERHWKGSRGRLVLRGADVEWNGGGLALKNIDYSFEGIEGKAELQTTNAEGTAPPKLDVKVETPALDIDNLLPEGWSLLRDGEIAGLAGAASQIPDNATPERHVVLKAGNVTLNGVSARNVSLDFGFGRSGFDMQAFDLGDVGGASLRGKGSLLDAGDGPQGELVFDLNAADPHGFLRLAGLEYGDARWSQALGQTAITARVAAVPRKNGPELEFSARGNSGALNLDVHGSASALERGRNASLSAAGSLGSADSAVLARLFGAVPAAPVGPGNVDFEFSGSADQGFVYATTVNALGATADFRGTANLGQPYYGVTGKINARAEDGKAIVEAFGLPVPTATGQALQLAMLVAPKDGSLTFLDVDATLAGHGFKGSGELSDQGRLQLDLDTDEWSLANSLALAFMPWEGPPGGLDQPFAALSPDGLEGEVYLKPATLEHGFGEQVKEAVIGFGFDRTSRTLSIAAPGEESLKVEVTMASSSAANTLEGKIRVPYALQDIMRSSSGTELASGRIILQGEFKASGSSPAAALASLEGKGNYWLNDAGLSRLSLNGFKDAVLNASTAEALSSALDALDRAPGSSVGQRIGNFSVASGEAEFSAFGPQVPGVAVETRPRLDLVSNLLAIDTTITLEGRTDLPPVTVTYSGMPGALDVRTGSSALAAKLGYELLSGEMAKLEKLQQEQQVLAAREEVQRREDEQRFEDYQATRIELRQQGRVRKFQARQRELRAMAMQALQQEAMKTGDALNRADLGKHARQLEVRRRLNAPPEAAPVPLPPAPVSIPEFVPEVLPGFAPDVAPLPKATP